MGLASRLLLAAAATLCFCAIVARDLDSPGLYYDEAHQAAGAFAYVGKPTQFFAQAHVGGLPMLNMPYSGAIKTALYGVWLRATGHGFDLVEWRLLGIALSAAGVFLLVFLAGRGLGLIATTALAALTVTDGALLLCSRHDWGPVALAFLLRGAFVGLWCGDLGAERRGEPARTRTTFVAAALVGFSFFEKLSNLVLLGPFLLFLWGSARRRTRAHFLAALLGGLLGAAPLLVVNAHSLIEHGALVSAQDAREQSRTWADVGGGLFATASVGAGYDAADRILLTAEIGGAERRPSPDALDFLTPAPFEALAVVWVLLAALFELRRREASTAARCAQRMVGAWFLVALTLEALPGKVDVHHRVAAGTFLAAAAACAVEDGLKGPGRALVPYLAGAALLFVRVGSGIPASVAAVGAPHAGDVPAPQIYRPLWRPELDRACRAAAALPDDVLVLAPDWGVGVQVYCYANGAPGRVREVWRKYDGAPELRRVLDGAGKRACVVLAPATPSGVGPPSRYDEVLADLRAIGWTEVAAPHLGPGNVVRVARFER